MSVKDAYTYVIYDEKYDLYKIGRTTSPVQRFHMLCKRGEVYPVALFPKDVELKLHHLFADNRVKHPEEKRSGVTEYFKRGGKFDEFVEKIDETRKPIPYCSIATMAEEMTDSGGIVLADPLLQWGIDTDHYAYYKMGIAILSAAGKLVDNAIDGMVIKDDENLLYIKGKLSITDELYSKILREVKAVIFSSTPAKGILPDKFVRRDVIIDAETVIMIISKK